MLVSVIVPNYNHSLYLKERLDSILKQTFRDYEIIILDDCSTDGSRSIIESYRNHPQVSQICYNTENCKSTFKQWQRGFSLAKGKYIWIAESDDVASPLFLEKCIKALELNDDIQVAFTYSYLIDSNGELINKSPDKPKWFKGNGIYDSNIFRKQRMVYRNVLYNASMVVFRRSALDYIDNDYLNYKTCGDWYFMFELLKKGMIAEIPVRLNYFRQHPNKVTTKATNSSLKYEEEAMCVRHILSMINVSNYQKKCIRGRMTRRLFNTNLNNKSYLQQQFPDIYNASLSDILIYELDKITHSSKFYN